MAELREYRVTVATSDRATHEIRVFAYTWPLAENDALRQAGMAYPHLLARVV